MMMSKMKYPAGPIRQHKSLATGASLVKPNKSDKGGGFSKERQAVDQKSYSSSGNTGGPVGNSPASNMTPA
jgi:hypothetical protein